MIYVQVTIQEFHACHVCIRIRLCGGRSDRDERRPRPGRKKGVRPRTTRSIPCSRSCPSRRRQPRRRPIRPPRKRPIRKNRKPRPGRPGQAHPRATRPARMTRRQPARKATSPGPTHPRRARCRPRTRRSTTCSDKLGETKDEPTPRRTSTWRPNWRMIPAGTNSHQQTVPRNRVPRSWGPRTRISTNGSKS